jgi:hypothetical protein
VRNAPAATSVPVRPPLRNRIARVNDSRHVRYQGLTPLRLMAFALQASLRASVGLILSARLAGTIEASNAATSITPVVAARKPA